MAGAEVHRDAGPVAYLLAPSERRRWSAVAIRADALDGLSFDSSPVKLRGHLERVGEFAERIARALGVPDALCQAVRQAGLSHDLGKYDDRFQDWLNPDGDRDGPLAKSDTPWYAIERTRRQSGWPRGGRHELLSGRLLARWLGEHADGCVDAELVLHLVASHHGHGRPLVRTVSDPLRLAVAGEFENARISADGDLSAVDWHQPRRFRSLCERYGLWGLCLLEAIVRQADHLVSNAVDVA